MLTTGAITWPSWLISTSTLEWSLLDLPGTDQCLGKVQGAITGIGVTRLPPPGLQALIERPFHQVPECGQMGHRAPMAADGRCGQGQRCGHGDHRCRQAGCGVFKHGHGLEHASSPKQSVRAP